MPFLDPAKISRWLHIQWQKRGIWAWATLPLGTLTSLLARMRRTAYHRGWLKQTKVKVPVIVVGNIYVGGSGKSPLVLYLARFLKNQGFKVGIICSGYRGNATKWPQNVTRHSDPNMVGDEAVMLSTVSQCPVVAGPQRALAARQILAENDIQIILSDDGFSHGALARDIDIVVFDAMRGLGNGWCLPAGPLREKLNALRVADMHVWQGKAPPFAHNEYGMTINAGTIYGLHHKHRAQLNTLRQNPLHAIAGIGNPQRFFDILRSLNLPIIEHTFADHHHYQQSNLVFNDAHDIITTEKDAVKLKTFTLTNNIWVLPIETKMCNRFDTDFLKQLQPLIESLE